MFSPKNMATAVKSWEYFPAAAGTYVAGQLLNADAGVMKPVAAASKTTPGYLCMANITVAEGDILPVQPIVKDDIYVTALSAEAAGAVIGTKLQVSAGGLQADNAAAGTFEIVYLAGTEAGSEVHGRFR